MEDSHLDVRAAAIKVFMDDYEGLDFATWSRRIIREKTGKNPSDDFREVERLVRETNGLSMKLSGGFGYADAQDAHQETKFSFHGLREVARKGWSQARELLVESPSGKAIATAVERLAQILGRERLAKERTLKLQPAKPTMAPTSLPKVPVEERPDIDRPSRTRGVFEP